MLRHLSKSLLLLLFAVIICSVLYPLALWGVGQVFFCFQANGSLLQDTDGKIIGSKLIAQPFTKDEYFQPRPSAASYDGAASSSSSLAASNYALRDRVGRSLGTIVRYNSGENAGKLVGPDIDTWFQHDTFQGKPHIVAQWATQHNSLASAWVSANKSHEAFVNEWTNLHPDVIKQFISDNPGIYRPQASELAVVFFQNFSSEYPGKFPGIVNQAVVPVNNGAEIQSIFFDMWRGDNPNADLQNVPGDLVTTSASGLDPHITLQNAEFQLPRVAKALAEKLKRDPNQVTEEIQKILDEKACAPFKGLIGEKVVNVLEVNLEIKKIFFASPLAG